MADPRDFNNGPPNPFFDLTAALAAAVAGNPNHPFAAAYNPERAHDRGAPPPNYDESNNNNNNNSAATPHSDHENLDDEDWEGVATPTGSDEDPPSPPPPPGRGESTDPPPRIPHPRSHHHHPPPHGGPAGFPPFSHGQGPPPPHARGPGHHRGGAHPHHHRGRGGFGGWGGHCAGGFGPGSQGLNNGWGNGTWGSHHRGFGRPPFPGGPHPHGPPPFASRGGFFGRGGWNQHQHRNPDMQAWWQNNIAPFLGNLASAATGAAATGQGEQARDGQHTAGEGRAGPFDMNALNDIIAAFTGYRGPQTQHQHQSDESSLPVDFVPRVDIFSPALSTQSQGYTIHVSLPGATTDDDINLFYYPSTDTPSLRITGVIYRPEMSHTYPTAEAMNSGLVIRERDSEVGVFDRTIYLPSTSPLVGDQAVRAKAKVNVEEEGIKARLEAGVLKVWIPVQQQDEGKERGRSTKVNVNVNASGKEKEKEKGKRKEAKGVRFEATDMDMGQMDVDADADADAQPTITADTGELVARVITIEGAEDRDD